MSESAPNRTDVVATVSPRLDGLIYRHRFTIAVTFPVTGAVLLVAAAEGLLPTWLTFNAALILVGVVVMRSPLLAGVLPVLDRRAVIGVAALSGYAYGVEYVGVTTGVPYGAFSYGVDLGPTVGGVPVALPVFFIPMVVNAYLLTQLLLGDRARSARIRLPGTIAVVVAQDLVLDPGAVALGFWSYVGGGPYYGVPVSNYLGWVLSATVAVLVLDAALDRRDLLERLSGCAFMLDDLVSFVIFWGAINAWFGNWAAVLVAGLFGAGLLATDRFDFPVATPIPWRTPR